MNTEIQRQIREARMTAKALRQTAKNIDVYAADCIDGLIRTIERQDDDLWKLECSNQEHTPEQHAKEEEWISVKDRLPTGDGEYLVCVDVLGKTVYAAIWNRAFKDYIQGESGWLGKVWRNKE